MVKLNEVIIYKQCITDLFINYISINRLHTYTTIVLGYINIGVLSIIIIIYYTRSPVIFYYEHFRRSPIGVTAFKPKNTYNALSNT